MAKLKLKMGVIYFEARSQKDHEQARKLFEEVAHMPGALSVDRSLAKYELGQFYFKKMPYLITNDLRAEELFNEIIDKGAHYHCQYLTMQKSFVFKLEIA